MNEGKISREIRTKFTFNLFIYFDILQRSVEYMCIYSLQLDKQGGAIFIVAQESRFRPLRSHFARHSIRETFSSPTFAVLFPFFLGRAPSAARIPPPPLSLSLFLNFLSLRSILTLLQRRRVISFLFLVLAFADLDATRLDPREKRRNESGTPLELLMLPPLTLSRDSSPPSLVKPPNIGR